MSVIFSTPVYVAQFRVRTISVIVLRNCTGLRFYPVVPYPTYTPQLHAVSPKKISIDCSLKKN